jgi:hypothetical protein
MPIAAVALRVDGNSARAPSHFRMARTVSALMIIMDAENSMQGSRLQQFDRLPDCNKVIGMTGANGNHSKIIFADGICVPSGRLAHDAASTAKSGMRVELRMFSGVPHKRLRYG